ncbi:MAG: hypothetical protein FJ130_13400 [Deltaproteobacteria bacterium]|nr:hypothetical protein [Deltaproteobacteria bacterium]
MKRRIIAVFLFVFVFSGCAGVAIHDNLKVPVGTVEGNQFTGIRYPFKVTTPPHWKMAMEFPEFLKGLGYDEPGPSDKEVTELYVFNPATQSSIQIDFTPASRKAKFSQEKMEGLVTAATGGFKQEFEEEHGKGIEVVVGPTEPVKLKGVQFAAKKFGTYTIKGVKREQGWIYGFTEPYQLFILYMVLEKEGSNDREDMKKILESFEIISKK